MANVTITQLPAAGPITGSELVPIVQDGQTVRTTASALAGSPVQTQTFLTLNQEPSLINSRYLQGGTGVGLVDNGALSYLQVVLNGASGSLEAAANGIIVKTGSSTVTNRSIAVTGDGLSITNGNGVSGNPTIGLTGLALAIAQVSGTGMLAVVGGTVIAGRQLYGTANQIDVAFGDGSNSPVFSLASNPILPGTGAVTLPKGTTAQRPVGQDGMIRYNTDTNSLETYDSGSWTNLPSGAVTLINTGTGLTGGPITSSGTISIAPTGIAASTYGSAAIVPVLTVNAQGQITGAIDTPIAIDATQITSGVLAVDRGGTGIGGYSTGDLIYASGATTLSALAVGTSSQVLVSSGTAPQWADASTIAVSTFDAGTTGLTPATPTVGAVSLAGVLVGENGGTGVNNSGKTITLGGNLTTSGAFALTLTQTNTTNVTLPTTGTLATLAGSEILTNKTINGPDNTLTNIANSSLTNSSVTYNGVTVALGASGTITATTTNALTVSTGLQLNSGTTFDGSAARTISIDSTVATLTGIQALTNKTINGSDNTLSNIGNSSLTNSSVTINSTNVSLGGSITITANTPNAVTFNNAGTGDVSGTTFDGSAVRTISYNTLGASPVAGSSSIVTVGTVTSGTWNATPIANNYLANSSITLGSTSVSLGSSSATLAGLTSVTVTQPPSSALQLATKQYVDDAVSAGITIHSPVRVESPTALNATYTPGGTAVTVTDITGNKTLTFSTSPSLSVNDQIVFSSTSNGITAGTAYYVYSVPAANQVTLSLSYNGPELTTLTDGTGLTIAGLVNAGVGATLTNAGTKAAIQIDGVTLSVTNRVLVYNQVNAYENGVYTVTTVGTPDPGGTNWVLTRATTEDKYKPDSTTGIGQGDYFFVQEGSTGAGESYVMTTNNPLIIGTTNLTFTQFSASQVYSAGTGLTLSGTQFSITNTGVSATTYGSASSVPAIAVNAQGQITSATDTPIAINGNQITSGTVGSAYLSGSYTGITGVGTLTTGTWNATTIAAGYGGTGLTTYTAGDLIYATASTTLAKLGIGASTYLLTSSGSAPQWTAPSSVSVGSATTATNIAGGSAGAIAYNSGAGTTTFLALGTQDYVLTAGATTPQYTAQSSLSVGSSSNLVGGTTGALPYQTGSGATTFLSLGTSNYVLTAGATAPQYTAQSSLAVGAATNISGGTAGAIPYNTGAGATTFLSLGTSTYILTAGAGAPQYTDPASVTVGSATNATNATNTGITLSTANADYYLTVVSANTGNLPQLVATGLTANPSTGKITGGIAGGTF